MAPYGPAVSAIALTLTACGGGSGSSTTGVVAAAPTPTPAPTPNTAPVFTSAAAISVQENASGTIYNASTFDANGDQVTYYISAGTDAGDFQITPSGALSFRVSPDFEAPVDGNVDNVYEVELYAVDNNPTGSLATRFTVKITVTNDDTGGAGRSRLLASGFVEPNNLLPERGSRVFVTERRGLVRLLDTATGTTISTPFLDVRSEVSTDKRQGLLGFVPAPDFATSGVVYASLINLAGDLEIRRYRLQASDNSRADPATADLILKVPGPASGFASGWIGFGPDGFLYITTGSGLTANTDPSSLQGKLLRIDVASDAFPSDPDRDYAIPASNPTLAGRPEIFAYGFRAPRFATIDPVTGYVFASDFGTTGSDTAHGDEINLIRPQDAGGDYSATSGSGPSGRCLVFLPSTAIKPIFCLEGLLPATNTGDVVVGPLYRGVIERLRGRLLYGFESVPTVKLFADIRTFGTTGSPAGGFSGETFATFTVGGFGTDAARNAYFLTRAGEIYIIEPS